jgi:hypothetical protein
MVARDEPIERRFAAAWVSRLSCTAFIFKRFIRQIKAAIVVDQKGDELLLPDWRLVAAYHKHPATEAGPRVGCSGGRTECQTTFSYLEND